MASCHLPVISDGNLVTTFRGRRVVDGGGWVATARLFHYLVFLPISIAALRHHRHDAGAQAASPRRQDHLHPALQVQPDPHAVQVNRTEAHLDLALQVPRVAIQRERDGGGRSSPLFTIL